MEAYADGVVIGKTVGGSLVVQVDLDDIGKPKTVHENIVIVCATDFNLPKEIIGLNVEIEGTIFSSDGNNVFLSDGNNVFLADEIIIRFPQHDQGNGIHPGTIYTYDGKVESPEDRKMWRAGISANK